MSTLDSLYLAEALATALGWPAWATLDEVVEAATALGWCPAEGSLEDRAREALRAVAARERESASADVKSAEDARPCDDWDVIARAAWIAAGEALARRDYRAMREHAKRAQEAEERANLVIAAIFGATAPDPAAVAAAKRRVASMPADAADTCRKAVLAEMEAHAKRMRQERMRSRAEAAARRAAREAERQEQWRRKDAADRAEAERRAELLRPYVGQLMEGKLVQGCGGSLGEVQVPGLGPVQVRVTDSAGLAWGPARFRITGIKLPDFGVLTRLVGHVEP